MAERLIKIIKHGIIILATAPENVECWDEHLAKVMFGYRCGIQANTKFSPFMILTGRTPRLKANNYLQALTVVTDDDVDAEVAAAQFLQKVKFIASIHESVLFNVEQAQQKQKRTYATRKGKQVFEGLIAEETMVKMKKLGKKRALTAGRVHTSSLAMLMERETLILKRVVECASSRMLMDANGKGLVWIFRSITFNKSK